MKNLVFWASLPFLLPQALYVRRNAPRFAPAGGPTQGTVGDGRQVRLLGIGDSIIAGVGASELSKALIGQTANALADTLDCRVEWQALGVSGYRSRKVIDFLVPQMPEHAVDYIIVSVGVNDVTGLTSLRTWRSNLATLIDELHTHSPGAAIAISGLPPMHHFPLLPQPLRATSGLRARSFDQAARRVLERHSRAVHIPIEFDPGPEKFSADGYHPSERSYTEFGQNMSDALVGISHRAGR